MIQRKIKLQHLRGMCRNFSLSGLLVFICNFTFGLQSKWYAWKTSGDKELQMKRFLARMCTAVLLSTSLMAFAQPQDAMKQDEMKKDDNMKHDEMKKDDGMKHDEMKKDDGMKKDDAMANEDGKKHKKHKNKKGSKQQGGDEMKHDDSAKK